MDTTLSLIGRKSPLFYDDVIVYEQELSSIVSSSCFLVIGGAGLIGSSVI